MATFPRGELMAIHALITQGFTTYFPLYVPPVGPRDPQPLFPGYVFVRFDREVDPWRPIGSSAGVRRLFSSAPERPTPLPAGLIEALIENAGPRGIIGADDPEPVRQLVGQTMEILTGPLQRFRGVCLLAEGDRVRLLIEIFGRPSEIEFQRSNVGFAK